MGLGVGRPWIQRLGDRADLKGMARDLGAEELGVSLPEEGGGVLEEGDEVVARLAGLAGVEIIPLSLIHVKAGSVGSEVDHGVLEGVGLPGGRERQNGVSGRRSSSLGGRDRRGRYGVDDP